MLNQNPITRYTYYISSRRYLDCREALERLIKENKEKILAHGMDHDIDAYKIYSNHKLNSLLAEVINIFDAWFDPKIPEAC